MKTASGETPDQCIDDVLMCPGEFVNMKIYEEIVHGLSGYCRFRVQWNEL